ncbi:MAG: DNA replication/repair protein RecF [Beijerinckiaceae bacterium]|nr:DNA replication/repair protein RecF [Beijerinckiaceae bacterium]
MFAEPDTPISRAIPAIRRLKLSSFRCYGALDLAVHDNLIALTGENGAGKTNLIEAISLLTPGRGLRRADLALCARTPGPGTFAISADLDGPYGDTRLGTGIERTVGDGNPVRRYRLNQANAGSARAFADHLRVVWLTPSMDGLFTGPAGERRRFLDRLVLAIDADHPGRTNALDRALRNRNKLLEMGSADSIWLDAAEREIAELGIAVAAARAETVSRLASLIIETRNTHSPFPWAGVSLKGEVDSLVADYPSLEAEERYQALLRANRKRDAAAGRTLIGPQASDLSVVHGPKNIAAALASTGEQKALLTGLVLAHARLVSVMSGIMPIILLDEVAAHFDPLRRSALYGELQMLGAQVWMTGADPALFEEIAAIAGILKVEDGKIIPSP